MNALIDIKNDLNKTIKLHAEATVYYDNDLIMNPFYDDFKYSFCWSSNALEGNTLSLEETIDFLDYDEIKAGHKFSEYEEAKHLNNAIIKYLSFKPQKITEDWIININQEIIRDLKGYRDSNVYIGNQIKAIYYPPSFEHIPELMNKYLEDVNFRGDSIKEIISKTVKKHIEFERIHPFKDGNGRTGRMIMNQQLINNNLLPITIEPKSKYKQAFKTYDKSKDVSLMEHIVYIHEQKSFEKIIEIAQKYELSKGEFHQ